MVSVGPGATEAGDGAPAGRLRSSIQGDAHSKPGGLVDDARPATEFAR
jgi:hypothetical protein